MGAIVYRHIRLDTNEIFYIGVGARKARAYTKDFRNKFWHNIVNKHGYKVEIIVELKNYEDALKLEKAYIAKYGRLDLGTGQLCNMTEGGEGVLGYVFSDEHKAKISKANKGRKFSEEAKKNMSNAQKGRIVTEEHRQKISKILTGRKMPSSARPVMQFDLDGNYIKTFETIKEAAEELGKNLGHVSSVCKGQRNQTAGYKWKYTN